MKTVQLGDVMLLVLAVFIVVWGVVYDLWRPYWWFPTVVLLVAVFKKPR